MTEPDSGARGIAIAGGLAVVAVAGWLLIGGLSGNGSDTQLPPAPERRAAAKAPAAARPAPAATARPQDGADPFAGRRIASNGRLHLSRSELPATGPLRLALDLPDEARGEGALSVVIASTDGRRLEASASAIEGTGTGVRVDLDPAFLSTGRYLIQIDTEEAHALSVRRYVLDVR